MDSGDIMLAVGSTFVSGFIGGLTALYFYRLAIREGGQSTGQLLVSDEVTRRLVNAIGHALKNAGYEINFDSDGNVMPTTAGWGTVTLKSVTVKAEVGVLPASTDDRQHEDPPIERGVD